MNIFSFKIRKFNKISIDKSKISVSKFENSTKLQLKDPKF